MTMPRSGPAKVDQAFSDAAIDPSLWTRALDLLSTETGSVGALCLPITGGLPVKGRIPSVLSSESMDESVDYYLRSGWCSQDLRFKSVPRLMTQGIMVDADFICEDRMRREPYYQDFLSRFRLKYFAGIRIKAGDDVWCISLQRDAGAHPFSPREQVRLARLGNRISGAATVARAMASTRFDGMADALDMAGLAAVLIDRKGLVLRLNPAAERLLGKGLGITGRQLVGPDSRATQDLQRMLGAALGYVGSSALIEPVTIRRAGRRPLLLNAIALNGETGLPFAPARVLVVIRDFENSPGVLTAELRALFGLTKAEARIAASLMTSDADVSGLADELGLSVATLRTQLAAVFRKTETNRQSDLVKLLGRVGSLNHRSMTGDRTHSVSGSSPSMSQLPRPNERLPAK